MSPSTTTDDIIQLRQPRRRFSIAMVCDFFYPRLGGVENHVWSLAYHLIRLGHKVIVITHAYKCPDNEYSYGDDDDGTTDNTIEDDDEEYDVDERNSSLVALIDNLPKLNPTQERAAKNFLESKDSLHLVQGPPGTGKSTFLVNVICRRLAKDKNARILVTAPTNRAVTVLAQRFLDVVNSNCFG